MKKILFLILPILVIVTIAFTLFGIVQVRFEEERLIDDLMRKARAVDESLEFSVRHILMNHDLEGARSPGRELSETGKTARLRHLRQGRRDPGHDRAYCGLGPGRKALYQGCAFRKGPAGRTPKFQGVFRVQLRPAGLRQPGQRSGNGRGRLRHLRHLLPLDGPLATPEHHLDRTARGHRPDHARDPAAHIHPARDPADRVVPALPARRNGYLAFHPGQGTNWEDWPARWNRWR